MTERRPDGPDRDERRLEREIEAELRFHRDEEFERLRAAGHSDGEARARVDDAEFQRARRACVEIGRRRLRRQRRGERMRGMVRDLRHAARRLARSPGYTAVVVATLALGVGANAAVFNLVDAALVRPLPYDDAERLVRVWPAKNFNAALAREVGARSRSLERVSGVSHWEVNLTGEGDPVALNAWVVAPGFFELFSARPAVGSLFGPEATLEGNDGVVVLSHGLWVERFGADPGVVGRTIALDGYDHERRLVVGVVDASFVPPPIGGSSGAGVRARGGDVWIPLRTDPAVSLRDDPTWYVNWVLARLAPGASADEATLELERLAGEWNADDPVSVTDDDVRTAQVVSLAEDLVGDLRATLLALMAVVGLVLVIACANLASLAFARAEGQQRELAVRGALGAARGHLVRHVLAESVVLAALGGAAGLALGGALVAALSGPLAGVMPSAAPASLSWPVFVFTLLISLGAGVAVGLGPALRVGSRGLSGALRSGSAGAGRGRRSGWVNRLLVAGEVALATVVVITSVAVGRRFVELVRTDPGFRAEGVLSVRVPIPMARYPRGEPQTAFVRQVLERVQTTPGVTTAGIIHLLPLTVNNWSFPILVDGWQPRADEPLPSENFRVVAGDYFGTLEIPLVRGESFDARTVGPEGERVMLVNEAFQRRYFADREPIGATVQVFGNQPYRVIGVVGDVRQFALDREPAPEMYVPYSAFSPGAMWIMARGEGDWAALGAAIREAVWAVDPSIPVPVMTPLTAVRADSVARERLVTALLGGFAALALVLGLVGVYGVTAYAARGRRREWGVRLALGARPDGVIRRAVSGEMVPVALGAAAGVAGALMASRVAASFVAGVDARDPWVLGAVPMALVAAAFVAAWLPVWRTTRRVDPVTVLRSD